MKGTAVSAKTVAQKLLLKPDTTIWSTHPELVSLIGPLPDGVRISETPQHSTAVFVFASDAAALRDTLSTHGVALRETALLWVAYPKGNTTDINRDTLWPMLSDIGLRPIGQVAIDDTWSALRFRPMKEGEAPFTGGKKSA
jgi:hypothetical protein